MVKVTPEISTMISSSHGVLVADIHGSVHLLNRNFESINSWVAHVSGRVTHMIEKEGILITLGVRLLSFLTLHETYRIFQEKDGVRSPLLAVWDLGDHDEKTNAPNLLRLIELQLHNRPHPVCLFFISVRLQN